MLDRPKLSHPSRLPLDDPTSLPPIRIRGGRTHLAGFGHALVCSKPATSWQRPVA